MYQPPKNSTVANVVPAGDFQHIKAQLEDTQESLAAAFARIEVFRLREKVLLAELAKLRIAGQPATAIPAPAAAAELSDDAAAVAGTAADSAAAAGVQQQQTSSPADSSQAQQQEEQQQIEQQADWPLPCYVTEVEGHLPVMLISSGGRKVRGIRKCCIVSQKSLQPATGGSVVQGYWMFWLLSTGHACYGIQGCRSLAAVMQASCTCLTTPAIACQCAAYDLRLHKTSAIRVFCNRDASGGSGHNDVMLFAC
jgi:hypothetical protein